VGDSSAFGNGFFGAVTGAPGLFGAHRSAHDKERDAANLPIILVNSVGNFLRL
jgi:hypothetical protein